MSFRYQFFTRLASASSSTRTKTAATLSPAMLCAIGGGMINHPCSRRYAGNQAVAGASKSTTAAAAVAEQKAPSSSSSSLMAWYESYLQSAPVRTKMVTGGFLWGLGDCVAQVIPVLFFGDDDDEDDVEGAEAVSSEQAAIAVKHQPPFSYDFARTARAVFFGFAIHAPASHVHFNFLEWMTVKAGLTGLKITVFKTVMEQFVYWSWFSNSLYHGAMGAMQGMTSQQIYDRIYDVLWETQKAQWVFWIPVQLLNFRFVPVRHQLNVVLLTSIVWTALLSAWYPPEPEEQMVGTILAVEGDEQGGKDEEKKKKTE